MGSVICFIMLIFSFVLLAKNHITYKNRMIITDAIFMYNCDCIHRGEYHKVMSYNYKKSYEESLFSLFDWGYKNIVPPEQYSLIEPFIDEESYKKYK